MNGELVVNIAEYDLDELRDHVAGILRGDDFTPDCSMCICALRAGLWPGQVA